MVNASGNPLVQASAESNAKIRECEKYARGALVGRAASKGKYGSPDAPQRKQDPTGNAECVTVVGPFLRIDRALE